MKEEEKTDYSPDYKWLMDSHGFNEDEFNNLVNDYRFALTHLYDYLDDDDTIDAVYSGRAQFSPYMYSLLKNRGYGGMKMRDLTPEHWRNIHSDYMKDYDEFHKTHENWEPFEPDKTGYLSTAYQQPAPTQAALPQADAPIPTAEPEIIQPRQINVEAPQPQQSVVSRQQPVKVQRPIQRVQQGGQQIVDTRNPINSLANLLGPTPAEREAMERKALKNKSKMQAWAGLFDGLRQLGNLYAVSRGAKPQQFTDNPYQQIEANYQADRQRAKDLEDYRRQYAQQLYNIRKQGADELRRDALTEAQLNHYGNMDEVARQKAEIDKLKAARVIKMKDGSLQKYDPITGTVDELREGDPLYEEYMRSQINRNNRANTGNGSSRSANNGTYGYETTVTSGVDEQGHPWKKTVRKPTTGNSNANPVKPGTTVTHPATKKNGTTPKKDGNKGKINTGVNWNKKNK